jgi:hypothetical protein
MGGVGEALLILLTILLLLLLSPEYLRSRVTAGEDGEAVRLEEEEPPREWLLELLVEILARLATEDEPGLGKGFWLLGGGGGGGIAEGVDDGFGSLFLDELFLLSCGGSQMYALRLKFGLRGGMEEEKETNQGFLEPLHCEGKPWWAAEDILQSDVQSKGQSIPRGT